MRIFPFQILNPLSSSHPLKEHGTNNWINFAGLFHAHGGTYNVVRIKSATEREFIAQVKTDRVYYMHSFGQTKKILHSDGSSSIYRFIDTGYNY